MESSCFAVFFSSLGFSLRVNSTAANSLSRSASCLALHLAGLWRPGAGQTVEIMRTRVRKKIGNSAMKGTGQTIHTFIVMQLLWSQHLRFIDFSHVAYSAKFKSKMIEVEAVKMT